MTKIDDLFELPGRPAALPDHMDENLVGDLFQSICTNCDDYREWDCRQVDPLIIFKEATERRESHRHCT